MRPAAPSDSGLSLMELVAVLAIFAMVAVMGLQAVSGAARSRDMLAARADETAGLAAALTLLRADLEAVIDRPFRAPGAAETEPAVLALPGGGGLALSVGGQAVLAERPSAGLVRVIWRHDAVNRRLTRQVWPVLTPAASRAAGPEVVMLDGVERLDIRYGSRADGWQPQPRTTPADTAPPPDAVEVRLATARHGALRVVVTR